LSSAEVRGIDSNALEKSLPVQRMYKQNPKSLISILLLAHETSSRRKYAESFSLYLEALKIDSTQPLTSLCLAILLLFLCQHALVDLKPQVLVQASAFMDLYRKLRLESYRTSRVEKTKKIHPSDDIALNKEEEEGNEEEDWNEDYANEICLQQEIHYNFGRFFLEIKLNHFSMKHFKEVLSLSDHHPQLLRHRFSLTREAAHCLILLYQKCNMKRLALQVMKKYLTFS
jgi:hypothetical protein